jgi:predicted glycosyltransferase
MVMNYKQHEVTNIQLNKKEQILISIVNVKFLTKLLKPFDFIYIRINIWKVSLEEKLLANFDFFLLLFLWD